MTNTTTRTIVVLDPSAVPRELRHTMAPRLSDLRGRVVGFLWNSKPNGDILFARIEEMLRQKYEIARTLHQRKPRASVSATGRVLNDLASSAHAVVVGLGD